MQREHETHSELAIGDLQRRLTILGYRLDDEAVKGLFGEKTAAALASFKESTGLGNDDTLDHTTWTALKDASMTLGDRPLYLHIPHFRGRDVGLLQGALSSMGFSCAVTTSFGTDTEQALRAFQNDIGLRPTGILDGESLKAILRLRHVWEGKRGFALEGRQIVPERSLEILETVSVCFYGIDESTRAIANRVANLARATTVESRIQSAQALGTKPRKDMLLVGLALERRGKRKEERGKRSQIDSSGSLEALRVHLNDSDDLVARLEEALQAAREGENRLTIVVDMGRAVKDDPVLQQQEIATLVLDALCKAL